MKQGSRPGISIIVLNHNGAEYLDRLFESFYKANTYSPVEFIIVDHASNDHTKETINSWAEKLPLFFIEREKNYSFAASNNYAVQKANYSYVLFMNNDIIYSNDVLPLAAAQLQDNNIGAVGLRLDDDPDSLSPGENPSVQHVGIKFSWDYKENLYKPRQLGIRTLDEAEKLQNGIYPAVTGTFLLCRKKDFLQVNGFHEAYFYGLEDVDYCLKLYFKLKKFSLCINETSLQHTGGATKKAGLQVLAKDNYNIFKKRMGKQVAEAIRKDQGSNFWVTGLGKIAVVCHVNNLEYWGQISDYIKNIPVDYCLYVSVTEDNEMETKDAVLKEFPEAKIRVFPNRGEDIVPFLYLLQEIISEQHEIVCKIHTKKDYSNIGSLWREAILDGLLGSSDIVGSILNEFAWNPQLGMVGPRIVYKSGRVSMLKNVENTHNIWQEVTGEDNQEFPDDWGYFAGSCFWARLAPLARLVEIVDNIKFEEGSTRFDRELLNAFECIFGLIIMETGYTFVLINHDNNGTRMISPPGSPSTEHVMQTLRKEQRNRKYRKEAELIRKSGFFDQEYYLSRYKDVVEKNIDPALHYVKQGAKMGRIPNPALNPEFLINQYDEDINHISPGLFFLKHYIHHLLLSLSSSQPVNQLTYSKYLCYSMLDHEMLRAPLDRKDYRVIGYMEHLKKKLKEQYKDRQQNDLVSIIMPAYNRADIIYKAISSVLRQSYRNWELIVVDDYSKDNTVEVVNSVNDSRVQLLQRKENGGASKARNDGLKASKGKWIAYLDTDDFWDSDYLIIMVNQLKDKPDFKMAYSAQYVWYEMPGIESPEFNLLQEEKKINLIRFSPFNRAIVENHNTIDINCFLHERSLYEKYGGWPENMFRLADWYLVLRYTSEHFPLAVPVLLSHHIEAQREDRITLTVDNEPDLTNINNLLYSENILDRFEASKNSQYGAYELLNKPLKTDYTRPATIVIPNYEALDYLRLCIDSVVEYTSNYEIAVVDNGSGSSVNHYLKNLEERGMIKLILNKENCGFTCAVNQGINISNPENDIVILNNDALVTRGWLEALRDVMVNVHDAGLAVPRQVLLPGDNTINSHSPKATAGREADANLSLQHNNILNPLYDPVRGYVELDFAPFFCAYIKRETIDEAGLLDVIYGPHYTSDRIYCDIVRNLFSRRIIYTPFSKVYHFLQQATKELKDKDPESYESMYKMNKLGVNKLR